MLHENSMLRAVRRQFRPFASTAAIVAALLLAGSAGWAEDSMAKKKPETAVRLLFTVPIPPAPTNTTGGMYAFDISFVDQSNQTYYLGDRSNQAVTVVNAKTGTFVQHITATPPFAGVVLNSTGTATNNSLSGPNGVATDGTGTCLFAGDGPSRVVSFTIPSGTAGQQRFYGRHDARGRNGFRPQGQTAAGGE